MPKTEIKKSVLEFISEFTKTYGVAPSYREIGAFVGLKSSSSVSRYIEQLKNEGKLVSIRRYGHAMAFARKIEFCETVSEARRVCLEVADGGIVFLDCNLEKRKDGAVTVSFSGIVDASQMKSQVGQVVGCWIDESEREG